MITVRRDAVRRKAVHRRAEESNETAKQWVRHRGLKLVFDHAEVVKCGISATANTLKSQDTPNLAELGHRHLIRGWVLPSPASSRACKSQSGQDQLCFGWRRHI